MPHQMGIPSDYEARDAIALTVDPEWTTVNRPFTVR